MDQDFQETYWPRYAPPIAEDILIGSRRLRSAFLQSPLRDVHRGDALMRVVKVNAPVMLIRSGFALRSCGLPDGRRAILDILSPGDFAGLENILLHRPIAEITAASQVECQVLAGSEVRRLMDDPCINVRVLTLIAETRWRANRLAASIGRLDAPARICVMLLDMYERLRRDGLINRLTFNLPLTQEQIADYLGLTLVHVNRILRRLREQRVVLFDRGVVIILNMDRLRDFARGLPKPVDILDANVAEDAEAGEERSPPHANRI